MKRLGSALLVSALLSTALAACGSAEEKSVRSKDADPDGGPVVTVVDAGSAPREVLRLKLTAGDSFASTMTMTMGIAMTVDGQTVPSSDVPPMKMGMSLTVRDVDDEGTAQAAFTYDSATVVGSGATARELKRSLQDLVGIAGTMTVTESGRYLDGGVDIPDDVPAILRSTMESFGSQMQNLTVPFPEEAVGPGARWTVTTEATLNGITTQLESSYELVSRDGDQAVLDVAIKQGAGKQDAAMPGLPEGTTVHVDDLRTTGRGRVVLDLRQVLPASSSLTSKGQVGMTVQEDGRSQEMVQRITTKVELEPSGR